MLSLLLCKGDRVIVDIHEVCWVLLPDLIDGMTLTKQTVKVQKLEWDFTDCPDLAQTCCPFVLPLGFLARSQARSLRIKETDRIHALQQELSKIGGQLEEISGTGH